MNVVIEGLCIIAIACIVIFFIVKAIEYFNGE
jgi:hypothetical protein